MKSVCIASSRKFYDQVHLLKAELDKLNIIGVYPNFKYSDDSAEQDEKIKRELTLDYFPKIDQVDVLYIMAPGGYAGTSVTIEASYAYAKGKELISSEPIQELALRSIVSKVLTPEELVKYLCRE